MVLSSAGDHDPVIPLIEVVGSAVRALPAQIEVTGLNVGIVLCVTFIVMLAVDAHCPASGVNV